MDRFPTSRDLLGKSASAYEHLRRAISHGQLRPGRRLSATGLAAEFRISETPVREALVRLSAEGFLAWEASKGHFTKPVTLAEQADLHDVLLIQLTACLQQFGGVGASLIADIALDAPILAEGPDADLQTAHLLGDLALGLVRRGGNTVLEAIISIIVDRTHLIRRLDLSSPERIAAVRLRAGGLLSALQVGDSATAMAILAQHLAERRRRLPHLVEAASQVVCRANYP